MKSTRGKQILLSLLLFLIIGANGFAQTSPSSRRQLNFGNAETLKLKLLTEKQHYVAYEPLLLTIKITNVSQNEGFDVLQPFHITRSSCEVFSPDGKKLPLNERQFIMMIGGGTQFLNPGQTFERTVNLFDYFDMGKQEGKYTVEYRYPLKALRYTDKNQPYTVIVGELKSRLTVEVTLPKTQSERKAMSIFRLAYQEYQGRGGINQVERNFQQILSEYPESQYAELALYYLAQYYEDTFQLNKAIQTYGEFIGMYPESFYAEQAKFNVKEVHERMVREQQLLLELEKSKSTVSEEQEKQK
ncbi:hypothetical protein FJZ31_00930 [Candidatus Poribacteria bacterium]|nr:hypothetical protein [Candidatus Poribacteria bacterium]